MGNVFFKKHGNVDYRTNLYRNGDNYWVYIFCFMTKYRAKNINIF